ncbi:hypothetical protein VNO77_26680 [Canavalia gladiata]|uniref:endo-polygalacturonase n=1 Tax=Canavalia gladiata TaxID=3824 RepID=A0AAN9KST7_CANGL
MRMSPQSVVLSLFIIMFVSFGSSLEDTYHLTNYKNHQHFGIINKRAYGSTPSTGPQRMVHVDDYGGKANDGRDDNKAFEKAWDKACSTGGVLVVPKKRVYHLKPIIFSGPCISNTTFTVHGTIRAWPEMSAYENDTTRWIVFDNVTNLRVDGGGTFNGNGKKWWDKSCKINQSLPCKAAPTAVTFRECNNLSVTKLGFRNPQQMHIRFEKCNNVRASKLIIKAPGHSPNTDGIHVTGSQNVSISTSIIGTGDDCISIVNGSRNVQAKGIICGPGHGISIGSLGAKNSEAQVSNVVVNTATLRGTTNGVRIKTWQGGSGYARDIQFMNILMHNVTNPIIIDQNYCDQETPCQEQDSAVQLSNIMYQNIIGTSASEVAIKLECSKTSPCKGIFLQNVTLRPQHRGNPIDATCQNVRYVNRGRFFPQC